MTRRVLFMVAIAFALAVGVAWFVSDEPLEPEARAWLDWHHEAGNRPSIELDRFIGLAAPADRDPVEWGRARFEYYLEAFERSGGGPFVVPLDDPEGVERLEPPGRELAALLECTDSGDPGERGCAGLAAFLDQNRVLLERYRRLAPEDELQFPVNPTWLAHQWLAHGDDLARLEVIERLLASDAARAADLLAANIGRLRRQLAATDDLSHKIVVATLLNRNADLAVARAAAFGEHTGPLAAALAPLDSAEGGLERVMRAEFSYAFSTMEAIRALPASEIGWFDWLGVRLLTRPNMIANDLARTRHRLLELDATALAALDPTEPIKRPRPRLRNAIGDLSQPARSVQISYAARLHDLDAKFALARLWLEQPPTGTGLAAWAERAATVNPYGPGFGARVEATDGRICLEGPLEDLRGFRCIQVPPSLPGTVEYLTRAGALPVH